MSTKPVALITGANGEIGRSLIERLHADGRYAIVVLDLTAVPERVRDFCAEAYTGNILDRHLLDQIAAHHEVGAVFHLAALLSSRGERDPELAHQINVDGTLHLLRMAHQETQRRGEPVRFIFPSSIAVYGMSDLDEKARVGRVREDQCCEPITMYGCNKLYCEHLGRYFTRHYRSADAASGPRVDFRALRFPGLISAETVPSGGTSDFGPEMLHAAAKGVAYECFVGPDARIPFMAMPDAIRAMLMLLDADPEALTRVAYNIGAISLSAKEIEDRVRAAFPRAEVSYAPVPARARIVDSWPEDVDDGAARADWGWSPLFDADAAFSEYLVPAVRARYG
ncbi:MAG: NAD-dependent epimerase/dehydratase family protein [Polyangiales bacterium]